jgi:hypothetical protein
VRVQVKTSRMYRLGRWEVTLATRGGNRSWNGVVKHFSSLRTDFLFAHVADGRRWFISAERISGGTQILLGGPKYATFEVESGRSFNAGAAVTPLDS